MTKALLELANELRDAAHYCTEISRLEDRCREVAGKLEGLAEDAPGAPPTSRVSLEPRCPFCARDPFHYVDNGVGMEAVAVTCCDLGDLYFRGMRVAPDEITMSWEDFDKIGQRLAALSVPPGDQASWQNIDTAPKDGTAIDIWSESRGREVNARWVEQPYTCDAPWGWSHYRLGRITDATHWMPLPAGPALASEVKKP